MLEGSCQIQYAVPLLRRFFGMRNFMHCSCLAIICLRRITTEIPNEDNEHSTVRCGRGEQLGPLRFRDKTHRCGEQQREDDQETDVEKRA